MEIQLGGRTYRVEVEPLNSDEFLLNVNGRIYEILVSFNSTAYSVHVNGKSYRIEKKSAFQILGEKGEQSQKSEIKAFMPGKIIKILAVKGEEVLKGQAVLILEAMKMQNEIKSPQKGVIKEIAPKVGESIETGSLLFSVE